MTLASTRLEEVLLALKIAFLVLLYALIWRIIRTVSRDMRAGPVQESFIMPPVAGGAVAPAVGGRLVVEREEDHHRPHQEADHEPLDRLVRRDAR